MNSAKTNHDHQKIGKRNKKLILGEFVSDPEARQKLVKKGITEVIKHYMTEGANSAKKAIDYFKEMTRN